MTKTKNFSYFSIFAWLLAIVILVVHLLYVTKISTTHYHDFLTWMHADKEPKAYLSLYGVTFFMAMISVFPLKGTKKYVWISFLTALVCALVIIIVSKSSSTELSDLHIQVAAALTFHSILATIFHNISLKENDELCQIARWADINEISVLDVVFTATSLIPLIPLFAFEH